MGYWGVFKKVTSRVYNQEAVGGINSFTGINVSSAITGNTTFRGIATIASGTTVATVAAAAAQSGAAILATIYQYVNLQNSIAPAGVGVQSVATGQFLLQTVGSVAPTATMFVSWTIVR